MQSAELRARLEALAEPAYQAFSAKLLPTVPPETILGVRLPKLRALAKELSRGDAAAYLENASDELFEERMLQGMVIGSAKLPLAETFRLTERFVPKIDCWSICDSFCTSLRAADKYPEETWAFLQPYLCDEREYPLRFGVVTLLAHYIDGTYLTRVLEALDRAPTNGQYYAQMAVAWAVSVCVVKFPDETLPYLKRCRLDEFTRQKAIQKSLESFRADPALKEALRALKKP